MTQERESRPGRNRTATDLGGNQIDNPSLPSPVTGLGDLDALAENLRGVFVLQLQVDDSGHRRTYYYKNLKAAERAVARARTRGRTAHLSLVQMLPVGVIGGGVRG